MTQQKAGTRREVEQWFLLTWADVRQGLWPFFFLTVFLLLNLPSKHGILHSWVPVLSRKGDES